MLNRRREALAGLSFLISVSGFGANTLAADLGGNCCADLEERIAELENSTARKGNRKVSLTIGGQVNEALMFWDDGKESDVYQGTNYAARSRFRFVGDAKINSDWSTGYLLEIGVTSNRLNRTNQDDAIGFINTPQGPAVNPQLDVRHSAWWIQNKDVGRAWVGKTDQATERITEITLANTNNFLKHYGRWNGSFFLRKSDGNLSNITWGNILPQTGGGEGVPGEGDRWNVVKFDTREFAGFTASAAYSEAQSWDVALRYGGAFSGVKLAWGIGYQNWGGDALGTKEGSITGRPYIEGAGDARGCSINNSTLNPGDTYSIDCESIGFSGSVLHEDTGLFLYGAYGQQWDHNRSAAFKNKPVQDSDSFYAINAGIERKFFDLGKSTFYGEYENYDTGAIISGNGLTRTGTPRSFDAFVGCKPVPPSTSCARGSGSEVNVWGLGFNQNIEKASIDLYVAWRRAEAEVFTSKDGTSAGEKGTKILPMDIIMTGAVIKF